MFHKQLDEAWGGENCGLLLRGTKRDDVERGQVVVKPGSVTPHHQLRGHGVHPVQGRGRPSQPVLHELPPAVLLPYHGRDRRHHAARGHRDGHARWTTEMSVELIQPIAMEEGLGYAIREGGRTVGAGTVTKILK